MDQSINYQKMCIAAWPYIVKLYDPIFSRRRRMLYTDGDECQRWDDVIMPGNHHRWFPLYEQDQLQIASMAGDPELSFRRLAESFGQWFADIWDAHKWSMEEAWLRYVMKRFSLGWNGEKWVNLEDGNGAD